MKKVINIHQSKYLLPFDVLLFILIITDFDFIG